MDRPGLRALGIEPLPKLNFSTCHDAWLGPYSRMVSTPAYYDVCRDLIDEVAELFGGPRFFHLGMDEETAQHVPLTTAPFPKGSFAVWLASTSNRFGADSFWGQAKSSYPEIFNGVTPRITRVDLGDLGI